jgi:serine/threonine protein kinase
MDVDTAPKKAGTGTFGIVVKNVPWSVLDELCVRNHMAPLSLSGTGQGDVFTLTTSSTSPYVVKCFKCFPGESIHELSEAEFEERANNALRLGLGQAEYSRLFAALRASGRLLATPAFSEWLGTTVTDSLRVLRWDKPTTRSYDKEILVFADCGQDLYSFLEGMHKCPERKGDAFRVLRALRGSFDALAAMHALGMHHGDVKHNNIMVLPCLNEVRLIDLGMAPEEKAAENFESPMKYMYWPLDIYYAKGMGTMVPADMWSVGRMCDKIRRKCRLHVPEWCPGPDSMSQSYFTQFGTRYPQGVLSVEDQHALWRHVDIFMLGMTLVVTCAIVRHAFADSLTTAEDALLRHVQAVAADMAQYDVTLRVDSVLTARDMFDACFEVTSSGMT